MKKITLENYRTDPHYSRIVLAVSEILGSSDVVSPVEVFINMALLRREALEDWRFGRIPYLERVITCNLAKASRILRILRMHAHDLNLRPSPTVYVRFGKGPKQRLRFSKTSDPGLEMAYALHFMRNVSKRKRPSDPIREEKQSAG
jgi:hypothetical protein